MLTATISVSAATENHVQNMVILPQCVFAFRLFTLRSFSPQYVMLKPAKRFNIRCIYCSNGIMHYIASLSRSPCFFRLREQCARDRSACPGTRTAGASVGISCGHAVPQHLHCFWGSSIEGIDLPSTAHCSFVTIMRIVD